MNVIKLTAAVMAAALVAFGMSGVAAAFHDDGVAYCEGCHTMHNSQDGTTIVDSVGPYLLKGASPSSTCLGCHAAYGQLTNDGSGYGAGGDFYWLTRTWTWTAHSHTYESTGDSHGHNIIAADFGLPNGDLTLSTAPGGSYMSQYLGCNSCHDPHGSQGNERLLYGVEETAADYPGGYSFSNPAPIMAVTSRKTRIGEAGHQPVSDSLHTAYGSGMSEWCANCHGAMLNGGDKHPAGEDLSSDVIANYNAYISTDVLTGDQATAYWEMVPFETGATDPASLSTTSTEGPVPGGTAEYVMCLSCHRSHASAFPDIGRWDFRATLIAEDSHPLATDTGASADDVANKYYGRTFTAEQRNLCNKCHVQD